MYLNDDDSEEHVLIGNDSYRDWIDWFFATRDKY